MRIDENTSVTYLVCDRGEILAEFETRQEANNYIDDRDDHGYNTVLWSVEPIVHYEGD